MSRVIKSDAKVAISILFGGITNTARGVFGHYWLWTQAELMVSLKYRPK
jgi:hypothetical protein